VHDAAASAGPQLRTERLLLRRWRPADLPAFAAINADPEVMRHFPTTLSREASAALLARIEASFETHGYGLWALELPEGSPLVGCAGIAQVAIDVPFAPAVELAWRLDRAHWGRGLASEAARAAAQFAFGELAVAELIAYTAQGNARSRRVMERLGMRRDPAEDFVHPDLPPGHPLAEHVLYRLAAPGRISSPSCAGATPTPPDRKN
jgi:RimJ/RimL family protein N-acetyltransferase